MALLIDGTVELFPRAFDFHVGLVKPPPKAHSFLDLTIGFLQAWGVMPPLSPTDRRSY